MIISHFFEILNIGYYVTWELNWHCHWQRYTWAFHHEVKVADGFSFSFSYFSVMIFNGSSLSFVIFYILVHLSSLNALYIHSCLEQDCLKGRNLVLLITGPSVCCLNSINTASTYADQCWLLYSLKCLRVSGIYRLNWHWMRAAVNS